ncbi:hypothetical protein B0O99DRAFT_715547, partial [Bisporella sp. PMI_857]
QNCTGKEAKALLHVCDIKQEQQNVIQDAFLAPGNQSIPIGFYSDSGDNVSLYCWATTESGGELYLSSAWKIYNELAQNHKDVLHTPVAPWEWQRSRSYVLRFFLIANGKLIVNYQKRPLRGTKEEPRNARLPPLSNDQEIALQIVDRLAFENAVALS